MENKKKSNSLPLIVIGLLGILVVFLLGKGMFSFLFSSSGNINAQLVPENNFAIITISGVIQEAPTSILDNVSYNHANLMDCVDRLMMDDTNKGILLKVNSGGGSVYQSDEFYLKLMEYKEKTGRPIHAYFEETAASGAYYIACAADYISANRNCWTGSIGVIISYYNYSELLGKLGVEEIVISTGANKGMGSSAAQLTEAQKQIYQDLVDEPYNTFVEIVARSRHLDVDYVRELADGRVYSAKQAVDNGLINSVGSYDEALMLMEKRTDGAEGYNIWFDSDATWIDYIFAKAEKLAPKNEFDSISKMFSEDINGRPLYYFVG